MKAGKKPADKEVSMDTNQTNGVPVTVEYRNGQERVNAQELHTALGVGTRFNDWINRRIEEYGFIHGEDYEIFDYSKLSNQDSAHGGDRRSKDYSLSLGMAKELAMLEKNERGREIRKYFIAVEKRAREVSLLFQKLGGAEQAMTYALMGRIYQVFAGNRKIGINTMFKIMEYALARSPVTGEYFLAADIARLVSGEKEEGYSTGKSSVERYITEIRGIVAEFDFIPTMVREPNGGYHALPSHGVVPADRPGFPLNLPYFNSEYEPLEACL
jgi:phage anti-repressor protein